MLSAPKPQRDIFADLPNDNPLVPPVILAWNSVNQTIDRQGFQIQKGGKAPKKVLAFPDPGLLFGVEDTDRQTSFLFQWDHMRPAFLRSLEAGSLPQTVNVWRKVLAYKYLSPPEVGAVVSAKMQAAEDARKLVHDTIRIYHPTMPFFPTFTGSFDPARARLIIRELCMVNFRAEILYLDNICDQTRPQPGVDVTVEQLDRNRALHKRQRKVLIADCFGGDEAVPHPDLNMGLAATVWVERYAALKSFWTLLNTWPRDKPTIWRRGIDMDLTRLENIGQEWERMLAEFYVQSAFNVLGCPPSLPRRI